MIFKSPITLAEALDFVVDRELLPTSLSSAEIAETWAPEVRRQAIFSARVNHAGYLHEVRKVVGEMVSGKINQATARLRLREVLEDLGYTPEGGFPDAQGGEEVPPAERGELRDVSSRQRRDLMLQTLTRQEMNRGWIAQWADEDRRWAQPAWELVRIYPRVTPRGFKRRKGELVEDAKNAWPARWAKAGGKFFGGRMIARVDDPVWAALGAKAVFGDGLDNPYPPFAFNSGFGLKAIRRTEAVALGVITKDETPGAPATVMAAPAEPEVPSRFDPEILKGLKKKLQPTLRKWKSGETRRRAMERARGGAGK